MFQAVDVKGKFPTPEEVSIRIQSSNNTTGSNQTVLAKTGNRTYATLNLVTPRYFPAFFRHV
jgi:hypothetical protein